MLKNIVIGLVVLVVATGVTGCGSFKSVKKVGSVVVKDVALEDQLALNEKFIGEHAWTRAVLEDLSERVEVPGEPKKKIIFRDTKVTIVEFFYVYNGAVTVDDPTGKRISVALDIERPLTPEKIETRMDEIFWFKDPTLRHVDYIRQWGKRTAQAVINHEVFAGMPADAAQESWGTPDEVRVSEIGSEKEEQWVYKESKRSKYVYVINGKVGRWEE